MANKKARHILNISGGKDSAALALYMKDKIPDIEYIFCDTGEELPETYQFLDKLEPLIGKKIKRLNPDRPFKHWIVIFDNYLPSSGMRWCTRQLKIKPFEKEVGNDRVYSYIGIRADEDRGGYISKKENIIPVYPFKDDGLVKRDIFRILEENNVELPSYYQWRSRAGCYFCFFQQKIEWVGLLEKHPKLYKKAMEYERIDEKTGTLFTWCDGESLEQLAKPKRVKEIKEYAAQKKKVKPFRPNQSLMEVFGYDDYESEKGCLICHL
ncbi:MAG: phosphoadenosine phosphosulfate reductase family protein [Cyanobacteriota bacterium]